MPFRRIISTYLLTVPILVLVAGCGSQNSSNSPDFIDPFDPATATLEEILERTKAAGDEITSYKTRGTVVVETSSDDPDEGGTGELLTEWQSPDRYRVTMKGTDPLTELASGNVILNVGTQSFYNVEWPTNESSWIEMTPRTSPDPSINGAYPTSYLFETGDVELVDSTATADYGSAAFEITIQLPSPKEGQGGNQSEEFISQTINHHLTISTESFLVIEHGLDATLKFEDHGSINRVEYTEEKTVRQELTYNFYDHNEPVSIEIPENYQPWQNPDLVPETAPPHTPTPISGA